MEKFKEALKHSDIVKVVLTGVGETFFSTEEVSKYIDELERLIEIGKAKEKGVEVIWDDEDMYCGNCDNYVYDDENYCKECGVKLLIHGRDMP